MSNSRFLLIYPWQMCLKKRVVIVDDVIDEDEEGHTSGSREGQEGRPSKLCCSVRFLFSILCFIALFNISYVRVGISMALLCMVNPNPEKHSKALSSNFLLLNVAMRKKEKEFNWSPATQGYMTSAVFYGFVLGPTFGGFLSFRFGGKIVLVVGTISTGVTNLFASEAARLTPYLFFVVRVFTGFFAGFILPAFYDLVSHWIVPEERQLLVTGALVSIPLANIVCFPIGGFLCKCCGWVWLFYTLSIWMITWGVVFIFMVYDFPDKCPFISQRELIYLTSRIPKPVGQKIPWKYILKSLPIYAYIIMHFCMNYVYLTILLSLPLQLSHIHKLPMEENSLLSATPFVGSLFMRVLLSLFFEQLRMKLKLSKNALRKIFVMSGALIVSAFLVVITLLSQKQRYWVVACFILATSALELCLTGGYLTSLLDLCPSYANVLTGIANTIGNTAGLLCAMINGLITIDGTREEYNIVFYIAVILLLFSATFYSIFGQNSLQYWGLAVAPSVLPVPRPSLVN